MMTRSNAPRVSPLYSVGQPTPCPGGADVSQAALAARPQSVGQPTVAPTDTPNYAAGRGAAGHGTWDLRPGQFGDLLVIMDLEAQGFRDTWSEQAWRDEMERAAAHVLVAGHGDDRPQGVVAVVTLFDTADLLRVVVAPAARRQGCGRTLIEAGLDWAAEQGADRMLLEVSAGNAPAVHLYKQLGFVTLHERLDYYGPGDHALVMERRHLQPRPPRSHPIGVAKARGETPPPADAVVDGALGEEAACPSR